MRTLVLHPVRQSGRNAASQRDPSDALSEAVSLSEALDLEIVGALVVPVPKARAATLFGTGKLAELTERITDRVNNGRPEGGRGGPRGPRGGDAPAADEVPATTEG